METENVIINSHFLNKPYSGSGQYIAEILKHLPRNEYTEISEQTRKIYTRNDLIQKALFERWIGNVANTNHATLWSPYHSISHAKHHIMTIHDAIGFIPTWQQHLNKRTRFYLKKAKVAASKARAIITVSEYAKQQIVQHLGIPSRKITVIPLGVNNKFYKQYDSTTIQKTREKYNIPEQYDCYVGGEEPRKNTNLLAKLYSNNKRTIVIIGAIEKKIQNRIYINDINNKEKAILLSGAERFIWPSQEEGFGLPPLEALACGTHVIAQKISAMPEVLQDMPTWCNTGNKEEWEEKIKQPPHTTTEQRIQFTQQYSWEKTAKKTWEMIKKIEKEQ